MQSFEDIRHVHYFDDDEINSGGLLEMRCRVFVANRTSAPQQLHSVFSLVGIGKANGHRRFVVETKAIRFDG